jgi:hypothetical protein
MSGINAEASEGPGLRWFLDAAASRGLECSLGEAHVHVDGQPVPLADIAADARATLENLITMRTPVEAHGVMSLLSSRPFDPDSSFDPVLSRYLETA